MTSTSTSKGPKTTIQKVGLVLGLSPARYVWGTKPPDFGLPNIQRETWWEVVHDEGHDSHTFSGMWYQTPRVRHIWGEPQGEVYDPTGQSYFLDLIFVGVAFRVGQVMKTCMYSCADAALAAAGGSGSASASGVASGSGRLLGAASGYDDECLGLGPSVLHSLAPFCCMYTLWEIEKRHRGQFNVDSIFHALLDLVNDLFLILAGMHMQPANSYREIRDDSLGPARVLVPVLCALLVWMFRIGEISLINQREGARRQSANEFFTCLQMFCIWAGAIVLSTVDFGDTASNASASDASAALMWLGNLWWYWKLGLYTVAELFIPGGLTIERSAVCANTGFVIHRNNEFMFLMLGETVLQIVIAIAPGEVLPDPSAVVDPFFNVAAATAACGFVLAVCMMFSFRALIRGQLIGYSKTNMGLATQAKEAEELEAHRDKQKAAQVARKGGSPDQDDKQKMRKSNFSSKLIETKSFDVNFEGKAQAILLRMRLYNVLNAILWQAKSLAVMLVGVGVKLAMYNPMASPNAHFALAQRLELCIPLAVCFAIQLFHSLFVKTKHHYSWKRLAEQPMHVLVVLARISIIVGLPLLAFIRIEPLFLMLVLAGVSVVQCALLQAHDFRFSIKSNRPHPMRELPNALLALTQRRKREATKRRLSRDDVQDSDMAGLPAKV